MEESKYGGLFIKHNFLFLFQYFVFMFVLCLSLIWLLEWEGGEGIFLLRFSKTLLVIVIERTRDDAVDSICLEWGNGLASYSVSIISIDLEPLFSLSFIYGSYKRIRLFHVEYLTRLWRFRELVIALLFHVKRSWSIRFCIGGSA